VAKKVLVLLVALIVVLTACDSDNTGGLREEQKQTAQQAVQYTEDQPVPVFEWSLERHIMIEIYRARNEAAATFSYVVNPYDNSIIFECASVGYPIPGGTQLTNPDQLTWAKDKGTYIEGVLPMMEPNGLYSPSSSANTYVLCSNDDGTVSPVYVEWYVMAFPYPMRVVDGKWERVPQVAPSISIETSK
jgi:hypothetical protein